MSSRGHTGGKDRGTGECLDRKKVRDGDFWKAIVEEVG